MRQLFFLCVFSFSFNGILYSSEKSFNHQFESLESLSNIEDLNKLTNLQRKCIHTKYTNDDPYFFYNCDAPLLEHLGDVNFLIQHMSIAAFSTPNHWDISNGCQFKNIEVMRNIISNSAKKIGFIKESLWCNVYALILAWFYNGSDQYDKFGLIKTLEGQIFKLDSNFVSDPIKFFYHFYKRTKIGQETIKKIFMKLSLNETTFLEHFKNRADSDIIPAYIYEPIPYKFVKSNCFLEKIKKCFCCKKKQ